ncbi:putative holin - phage associated [Lachnospiraceae bacterium]|uniref:phage holin n=1 Tax=Extibacter sp. GGCC_0201 TaxID=2731209 RepID=UPI001AA0DA2D|nr:phage holin [Extibacter sp. GGCC_0201]MBO1721505.1 phage holin [Extibacter sp. GGCC_0201]BDF33585.1 putative holin - phage associated [Lachnospiraceae bacterium]BDF37589.1 putative holin - phage associated [Lachnospiraceae bacterium]
MHINWKLRLGNKVTLTAIIMAFLSLVYQLLGMASIVPPVSESQLVETAGMVINLLVLLGIVTDPTTEGVSDSQKALTYDQPKQKEQP